MALISFPQLPLPVRLATFATFFIGWVMFEELIIDRHHLDRFLPYYHVGNLCLYDLSVITILVGFWFWVHRTA
jgi:hypothetical protein